MPRKKKHFPKLSAGKNKKILTTRLMKISLIMDNYVYRGVPITVADAVYHLQELNELVPQCYGDAPFMQVNEKLRRCMTSIINENRDSNSTYLSNTLGKQNEVNTTYCPSPVYSLADEDRSRTFAQDYVLSQDNNENIVESIDLTDHFNEPIRMETVVEIHRAMSNLTMNDDKENDVQSQSILVNFGQNPSEEIQSQSVLKHYERDSNYLQQKSITISPLKADNNTIKNDGKVVTIPPKTVSFNLPEIVPNKTKNKATTKLNGENTPRRKRKTKKQTCTQNKRQIKSPNVDKINAKKRNQLKQTEKSNIQNVDKINAKKKNQLQQTEKSNIQTNTGTVVIRTTQKVQNTTVNDTIKNLTKNSVNVIPVYNKRIENDLSWMENIRYVREIKTDEYDAEFSSLADDFWTNVSMPHPIHEQDFAFGLK